MVLRMMAVSGAPQVFPFFSPHRISGASASLRGVDHAFWPGARRLKNRCKASRSTGRPAGSPSTVTPMAGAWDWPKIETVRLPVYTLLILCPPSKKQSPPRTRDRTSRRIRSQVPRSGARSRRRPWPRSSRCGGRRRRPPCRRKDAHGPR